jgi:hypothetical protein
MSRTKDALYRESGEADYDEAGSPPADGTSPASVTELHPTAEPDDTDRTGTVPRERTTPD